MRINFPVTPKAKGRPRFFKGRVITPKVTRDYERTLRSIALNSLGSNFRPFSDPLMVSVVFNFKRPKKASRPYPCRSDLDNYLKAVLDAMNEIIYLDDTQVVKIFCEKRFADTDSIDLIVEPISIDA